MSSSPTHFDFLVLGAGSGGLASARRAASYGVRAAIIEHGPIGGTCVNVGCVPKKIMWNAATLAEEIHDLRDYGFVIDGVDYKDNNVKFKFNILQTFTRFLLNFYTDSIKILLEYKQYKY